MSPRRLLRALAAGLMVVALLVDASPSAVVRAAGQSGTLADELGARRLDALRSIRESQPDTSLRGVLSGIAADASLRAIDPADLAGLETTLTPSGETQVAVAIEADAPASANAVIERVRALGGSIANRTGSNVEAYLPPEALATLANLAGVERIQAIVTPITEALTSTGVQLHQASPWQDAGIVGTGIKVGIIDGGFTGMGALLGSELPATVVSRCYSGVGDFDSSLGTCEVEGIDHGTAVAETIVDMAPGVSLYVANPFSLQDYSKTVAWMKSNGVKVINSSLATAYEGPGDGTDPTGNSLYTIVNQAAAAGILWINSSGNSGQNGWHGPFVDPDDDDFLNFSGSDDKNSITLAQGQSVVITARWNEVWGKAKNDYDLGIFAQGSDEILAASIDEQNGNDDPVETLVFEAPASGIYDITAIKHAGVKVSRFQLLALTAGVSPLKHRILTDTLPSPADSRAATMLTVGAVDVASPDAIEAYSSRGPTIDGRVKPDVVAGDCGATVTFGVFCGTSQSAPYVTGAAALVFAGFPSFTAQQVAAYLQSHAIDVGPPGPDSTFGFGRLDLGSVPGTEPPTAVLFTVQPGNGTAGAPLASQPVVRLVDASGTLVNRGPFATTEVTLALGSNPSGAVLACAGGLTRPADAGVASFDGCAVDRGGSGYTLVATAAGLAPTTSAPFSVAGPVIRLVFGTQPGGAAAAQPFAQQPVVLITDGGGQVLATGPYSTLPVTLVPGTNAGGGLFDCAGATTVQALAGVATFTSCTFGAAGGGTTLEAMAPEATAAISAPFTVEPQPGGPPVPTVVVTPAATSLTWGSTTRLEVRIAAPAGGAVGAGLIARLQSSADNRTWRDLGSISTDGSGIAAFDHRPQTNLFYRALVDPAAGLAGSASTATTRVTVRQTVILRPSNSAPVRTLARRTTIAFTITVRPASSSVPAGAVTLQLYRRVGSAWRLASTLVETPSATGKATISVPFNTAGKFYVRVQAAPTALNANSAWSPIQRFDVR